MRSNAVQNFFLVKYNSWAFRRTFSEVLIRSRLISRALWISSKISLWKCPKVSTSWKGPTDKYWKVPFEHIGEKKSFENFVLRLNFYKPSCLKLRNGHKFLQKKFGGHILKIATSQFFPVPHSFFQRNVSKNGIKILSNYLNTSICPQILPKVVVDEVECSSKLFFGKI